ncbi:hypothetical protein ACOME3_005827 [Neoechinorhynchus agilis]
MSSDLLYKSIQELCAQFSCPFVVRSEDSGDLCIAYEIIQSNYVHAKYFPNDSSTNYDHVGIPMRYPGLFYIVPNDNSELFGGLDNETDLRALNEKLQITQRSSKFLVNKSLKCYMLQADDEQSLRKVEYNVEPCNIVRIGSKTLSVTYFEDPSLTSILINFFFLCKIDQSIPVRDKALSVAVNDFNLLISLNTEEQIDLVPVASYGSTNIHKLHTIMNIPGTFGAPVRVKLYHSGHYFINEESFTRGWFEIRSSRTEQLVCMYNLKSESAQLVSIDSKQTYSYYGHYETVRLNINEHALKRRCLQESWTYLHSISPVNVPKVGLVAPTNTSTPIIKLRSKPKIEKALFSVSSDLEEARKRFKSRSVSENEEKSTCEQDEAETFDELESHWKGNIV